MTFGLGFRFGEHRSASIVILFVFCNGLCSVHLHTRQATPKPTHTFTILALLAIWHLSRGTQDLVPEISKPHIECLNRVCPQVRFPGCGAHDRCTFSTKALHDRSERDSIAK